ncbi:hypothetical protein [Nocardioides bruguierae]|uniref:hypothetical protein n=1 Tax=Nocardioides bruguierae TaxID=2945102 RepID=UPI00202018E8|nr:hypothetical protein [Nocardioides bruguierae]MCL8025646.1 hypothetical protein [Nocardioides bruguierae]
MRARLPRPVSLVLAACVLLGGTLTACTSGGTTDDGGAAVPGETVSASDLVPSPSSVAGLSAQQPDLVVERASFCDQVPDAAVLAALGRREGGRVPSLARWDDGDTTVLTQGLAEGTSDVAHEYGCRWTTGRGAAVVPGVQAWVYAPAVGTGRARSLARGLADSVSGDGVTCQERSDADVLGTVGATAVCSSDAGRAVVRAGLLGEAWLTCTVTAPSDVATGALLRRSDAWCAAVALAGAAD